MFNPFLDTKSMSDEEILSKMTLVNQRMMYAQNVVGDQSMIASLGSYLDALQAEYQERINLRMQQQWNSQFPEVIESDPDFKTVKAGKKSGVAGNPDLQPKFNKKFVRPDLDITPVPTRHADKKDPETK